MEVFQPAEDLGFHLNSTENINSAVGGRYPLTLISVILASSMNYFFYC